MVQETRENTRRFSSFWSKILMPLGLPGKNHEKHIFSQPETRFRLCNSDSPKRNIFGIFFRKNHCTTGQNFLDHNVQNKKKKNTHFISKIQPDIYIYDMFLYFTHSFFYFTIYFGKIPTIIQANTV